jgi:uncharacterized membrane protein YfcA
VTGESAIAVAAVTAAAAVHSGTGFGFAIVAAPVLAATDGARTVASTLAVVGTLVNALTLAGERRRPQVLGPTAARLVAWSLPGMAAGAAVLALAPDDVLTVAVALAVLAAVAVHVRRGRRAVRPRSPATPARTAADGALSGALATSTGLNGPPLVLHLLGRATPAQARDTLAAVFVGSNALTVATLAASGTFAPAPSLLPLAAGAAAGQALGRLVFARLGDRHEAASLAVVAFGAVAALALAADALG